MADPFRKVKAGDELSIGATAWNAAMRAAKAEKNRRHDRGIDDLTTSRNAAIVRVLNSTGGDRPRFSIVGLSAPIFTPTQSIDAFLRETTFRGVTPTSSHVGKFAILLEPAADGQVVRCYVAGVCPVKVNVTSTAHEYADVEATSTTRLTSAECGPAQLLWKELATTGEQWAIVRIGSLCL